MQINVILYGDTVVHDLDTEHYSSMEKHLLRKYNTVSFGIPGDHPEQTFSLLLLSFAIFLVDSDALPAQQGILLETS